MHALIALMDACHAGTQLALYEQTIVEILMELLERSEDRLRLVALLAVAWRHLNFLSLGSACYVSFLNICVLWSALNEAPCLLPRPLSYLQTTTL